MEIIITETPAAAASVSAGMIRELLLGKPSAVLGLATGSTPLGLYRELARMHREEGLTLAGVTTFNLDEYVGLSAEHPASYRRFMQENFFAQVDIPADRTHLPDGMAEDITASCGHYEAAIRAAGGIDLQVLGLGHDGHIGFNEPTSSLASRTRLKTLTRETMAANQRFFGPRERVPQHVITMGIGTIMDARSCLLLAFGEGKARAVAAMVEGPIAAVCPATVLQMHPQAVVIIDEGAAQLLQRKDYYRHVYSNKPDFQRAKASSG